MKTKIYRVNAYHVDFSMSRNQMIKALKRFLLIPLIHIITSFDELEKIISS